MTIQDAIYILTIIKEKSINKASAKLYVSQPALSKCIKKVENEYNITIFERSQGSGLKLTPQGEAFQGLAEEISDSYRKFDMKIRLLQCRNENNIVFGTTMQRGYSLTGDLMKWIYDKYPGYYMEVKTLPSRLLPEQLQCGEIDFAMFNTLEALDKFYVKDLYRSENYLYLRKGSPAAEKAVQIPGENRKSLDIRLLQGEDFTANLPGSGGRRVFDRIIEKNRIRVNVVERSMNSIRTTMADAGLANTIVGDDAIIAGEEIDLGRIYYLLPDQREYSTLGLVCRKGFEEDKRFKILEEALTTYYGKRR